MTENERKRADSGDLTGSIGPDVENAPENARAAMDIARDLGPELDILASFAQAADAEHGEGVFLKFNHELRGGNLGRAERYLTALEMLAGPETADESEYVSHFRTAVRMVRESLLGWDKEPIK